MEQRLEDRIYTYSTYLKRKYGRKVFRVGLSTGIICPHRINRNGCIFCNPNSFTGEYQAENLSIEDQLEKAIPLITESCGDIDLLAYFQDETSTAGNLSELKKKFTRALSHPKIIGLVVSTRPDYVNEEIIKLLCSFDIPVTIEIGLQTIHNKNLEFLNRGHDFEQSRKAIELCGKAGLEVGVHLIIGIPGENFENMKQTIRFVSSNKYIKQVKFHNLMIYKNTKLAEMYKNGEVQIFDIEDYIKILGDLIPYLRGDIVITRLFTSNILNTNLTIGNFQGNKTKWMNSLRKYIYENNIIQGSETVKTIC
ncbi:MAG TPA: TIGR01212 family radical SAM protein [Candidatus Cloacimonetes bacterium]|nr:TIGR01212 family radical SAM protein [Candidatus Cloacimonadota bacterium]